MTLPAVGGATLAFRGIILLRGLSVLDNVMAGRRARMGCGLLSWLLHFGPAARRTALRLADNRTFDQAGGASAIT